MAKPSIIELGKAAQIPILYEDRSILAVDKPPGWLLVPSHWDRTARNLQLAIDSSIRAGDFWAKSRNLKFLRYVHRLDAETSGVLLFAKSPGAIPVYSKLFESRQMQKFYLAAVEGSASKDHWVVDQPIGPDPAEDEGRMRIDRNGKEAQTAFDVLENTGTRTLLLVKPITGRMHQIRVHLEHCGLPVCGDKMYGLNKGTISQFPLGLRAVSLEFRDPFSRRNVQIVAKCLSFIRNYGFKSAEVELQKALQTGRGL